MFEQYLGSGANTFITIVAVIIGFVAAIGFLDFQKTKNNEQKGE